MSTRERWVVYPLLFLALGAALRDKFFPPSRFAAHTVWADEMIVGKVCCNYLEGPEAQHPVAVAKLDVNELTVSEPGGHRRAWLGVMDNQSGHMELYGRGGKLVALLGASPTGESGIMQTMAADGYPQVYLHSSSGWGAITAVGPGQEAFCTIGSDGENVGMFARVSGQQGALPLTRLVRAPRAPAKPEPDAKAKP